jgi:predicted PhzF superfamily epimerase YddE/YHI9
VNWRKTAENGGSQNIRARTSEQAAQGLRTPPQLQQTRAAIRATADKLSSASTKIAETGRKTFLVEVEGTTRRKSLLPDFLRLRSFSTYLCSIFSLLVLLRLLELLSLLGLSQRAGMGEMQRTLLSALSP